MSTKPQIELFLENESGTQQVAYPFVESDHVSLSNGMDIDTMIRQDVSMPTVTHEDLSFKVGVGDQDVSSAIVDSSVAEMTIKGKTYQNILPEPSTHVLTNNKEMFKVNEGLDPNVEIVDGVSKSAILSGKTRVNEVLGGIHKNISLNGTTMTIKVPTKILKTNTTYWFSMNVISNTCVNGTDDTNGIYISNGKPFNGWTSLVNTNGNKLKTGAIGRYFSKLTTANDLTGIDYVEFFASSTIGTGSIEINNLFICEVDGEESLPNYFEGMQSVKMPVLTTTGKNLIDLKNAFSSHCTIDTSNNTITGTDSYNDVQFYVTLEKGKTYRFSANGEYSATSQILLGRCQGYVGDKEIQSLNINNEFTYLGETGEHTLHIIYFKDVVSNIQLEEGSTPTPYEPYKSNILTTSEEVVLRSLPNGVKDTLNLNTGEYVQRIGEITFNGSETWYESGNVAPNHYCAFARVQGSKNALSYNIVCNSLPVRNILSATIDYEGCMFNEWASGDKANVVVKIANSKLSSTSVEGIKAYLQSNPLTIQYELATPVVKIVDLSSSGNWEKIVFDGSDDEGWAVHTSTSNLTNCLHLYCKVENLMKNTTPFSNFFQGKVYGENASSDDERIMVGGSYHIHINILKSRLDSNEVAGFKQWLSQNPITVWYQTATTLDSTQVKQPIFFKDGHIQLSSGVDNSLIPTLDYQAKTSNSYVMDLMKANTRYTMKAKSASGTFTIDGTSYGAGTNGTFTTPTSMTNKFLVMCNKTNEEVMIIEGDVVSKTVPYFKGIKSAFEDESKIEVLSTGKNLFDIFKLVKTSNFNVEITENSITLENKNGGNYNAMASSQSISLKKGCKYTVNFNGKVLSGNTMPEPYVTLRRKTSSGTEYYRDISLSSTPHTFTASGDDIVIPHVYASWSSGGTNKVEYSNITIEETANIKDYEPYKSNNTKIPLLSSSSNIEMEYGNFNEVGEESPHNDMKRCVNYLKISKHTNHIELLNNNKYEWFHLYLYDENKKFISVQFSHSMAMDGVSLPINKKAKFFRFSTTPFLGDFEVKQIYFNEPRSLPNGVRDEIILDRENSKAKIIQRVGKVVLDGLDGAGWYIINTTEGVNQFGCRIDNLKAIVGNKTLLCENMPSVVNAEGYLNNTIWLHQGNMIILHKSIAEGFATPKNLKTWLSQNPITAYYELATPIITEIDLEGYPYVYKDGHIFMNGDIAPVTEIKYSINQQHQIEASNQDLIRHQKEIDYLYKLIGEYVRVDYKNTLLSLNLELK